MWFHHCNVQGASGTARPCPQLGHTHLFQDMFCVVPPDPKCDVTIHLDGKPVVVPQGKPISVPKFSGSSFGQSEYLVYKESQARIRYLLKLKM